MFGAINSKNRGISDLYLLCGRQEGSWCGLCIDGKLYIMQTPWELAETVKESRPDLKSQIDAYITEAEIEQGDIVDVVGLECIIGLIKFLSDILELDDIQLIKGDEESVGVRKGETKVRAQPAFRLA